MISKYIIKNKISLINLSHKQYTHDAFANHKLFIAFSV